MATSPARLALRIWRLFTRLFFVFNSMSSQTRRICSAIAMFLTALALQWAATAPWIEGRAADGTRFRVSPIGIAHVVSPDSPNVPTVDCRWWPRVGTPSLCAVVAGSEKAYARLRLAYPCLQGALWLAIIALMLQALRIPRSAPPHVMLATALLVLIIAAGAIMVMAPPTALEVLQRVSLQYRSLGFLLGSSAAALTLASVLLLAERSPTLPER